MSDPFLKPEEPTAAEAIAAIAEDLNLFDDWMERYQFIIEMGRKLPPFPDEWANDAHRVPGPEPVVGHSAGGDEDDGADPGRDVARGAHDEPLRGRPAGRRDDAPPCPPDRVLPVVRHAGIVART